MKFKSYTEKIVSVRNLNNRWQRGTTKKLQLALEKSYKDLVDILKLSGKESVKYDFYNAKKKNIGKIIDSLNKTIETDIKKAIKIYSSDASRVYRDTTKQYLKDAGVEISLKAYSTIPVEALYNVINRTWGDNLKFSDRVWKNTRHAKNSINLILSAGIARGQSAGSMSKELKRFLVDYKLKPGETWHDIKNSVTKRGSLNYNAKRLAITEINNSYRETQILHSKKSPIVLGLKWNLASSHPIPDVCDVYAEQDLFGLGAGVYQGGAVPIDHPRGFCFLTDVLRPPEDWKKPKEALKPRKLSDKEFNKVLEKKNITEGAVKANLKAYKNSFEVVGREAK